MARKPREEVEGGIFHVYARGVARRAIFRDDADRRRYLALLGVVVAARSWRCLSYCLMDNHLHLLVETPRANLAAGMQRLHGDYARGFNRRHGCDGHVFQGRYGAVRVRSDGQLWTVAAYIADNPVAAGRCARAEDWPWSSHAAALGGRGPSWLDGDRLTAYLGSSGGDPRRRLAATVAARRGDPTPSR
jgi:putative transposase